MNRIIQISLVLISLLISQSMAKAADSNPGKIGKILFLGNSITHHGPSAKVDWTGNWGMAASAEEKDYVHLVLRSIAEATGKAPEALIENIVEFERNYATYDMVAKRKNIFAFKADVVVLAIGENVAALKTDEAKAAFKSSLVKLLQALKADNNPTIFVRSCFWADAAKDAVLKQACQEVSGVYVDISTLGKVDSNFARSERKFTNSGVAHHPGDKGMQAIATALIETMKNCKLLTR